jgi:hypothetical protein
MIMQESPLPYRGSVMRLERIDDVYQVVMTNGAYRIVWGISDTQEQGEKDFDQLYKFFGGSVQNEAVAV